MKNITSITKRDIFDLFGNGYSDDSWMYEKPLHVTYKYHGRLTEIEFLKKLYPLDEMESDDPRFDTAEEDIIQHTRNNDDWDEDWVFEDDRFGLLKGDDKILLDFLCAIFHPENRIEQVEWHEFLSRTNNLLRVDGYELYEIKKISNRSVYSWRPISEKEMKLGVFLPFSVRYEYEIENRLIKLPTFPKPLRQKLLKIFDNYNESFQAKTETGYNYWTSHIDDVFEAIKKHYAPSAFNEKGNYIETDDFNCFVLQNYPYCVFDAIELFSRMVSEKFTVDVNYLLSHNNYGYKLVDGRMEMDRISPKIGQAIKEPGLKELINDALADHRSNSYKKRQSAVEKLWDAFERLKTYYTDLDKKHSATKITDNMSKGENAFKDLFENEFKELSTIGNNFRIRHHETNITDITDQRHYDYLFMRCFALIDAAISFIEE